MVRIILTETSNYDRVTTVKQRFAQCGIISECTHQIPNTSSVEGIEICEKTGGKHMTLKLDGSYAKFPPSYCQVFSNNYDSNKTPLIIIFNFSFKDKTRPSPRLCKYSELSSLIESSGTKSINELKIYNQNLTSLLTLILEENDKFSSVLTYQLEKISGEYNNNRIKVTNETHNVPCFQSNGFVKHKHAPKAPNTQATSCVIFIRETLLDSSKKTIEALQSKNYSHICVYRCSDFTDPLLLEFNNGTTSEYYIQKKTGTRLWWAKLDKDKCKELLCEDIESNQIHSQLTANSYRKLLNLLKTLVLLFKNTIILLLDRQTSYDKDFVTYVLKYSDSDIYPNPNCLPSQPEKIDVKKASCPDLEKAGYVCYSSKFNPKDSNNCDLRLLMPSAMDLFSEIKILTDEKEGAGTLLSYLKNKLTLYVFFYGRDPRPLLFYYNGAGYKPLTALDYDNYWLKISDKFTFSPDSNDNEKLVSILADIIGSLTTVELSFKPKHIADSENEMPNSEGSQHESYIVQLISKAPTVKVTHSNRNCYRKYIHRPCDMDGKSDGYRLGFVTYYCTNNTNIDYDIIKQLITLESYYHLYDCDLRFPLLVVLGFKDSTSEYYRLTSKDPNSKKWTKIENGDTDQELLKKIKDGSNIESALYDIRKSLEITFTSDQKKNSLFNPMNCKEDTVSWATIGASVGGVGVGGGLGYAGYLFYRNPGCLSSLIRGYLRH